MLSTVEAIRSLRALARRIPSKQTYSEGPQVNRLSPQKSHTPELAQAQLEDAALRGAAMMVMSADEAAS